MLITTTIIIISTESLFYYIINSTTVPVNCHSNHCHEPNFNLRRYHQFLSFYHNSHVWQTDGQTDIVLMARTAVNRCSTVKWQSYTNSTRTNPHFSAFKRRAELAASKLSRVHWNSINTNRKSTTCFPMSQRWIVYIVPKPPKGGLKYTVSKI